MPFELRPGVRRLFRLPFFSARTTARDADDELQFLMENRVEYLVARGLSPADARAEALRRVGAPLDDARRELRSSANQRERHMHVIELADDLAQDVRYAARSLRKHSTFAAAVVATLAIGIGANTAIFTLIDALVLRSLPVAQPQQLAIVGDPAAVNGGWHGSPQTDFQSYPVYADLRDQNTVFTDLYASGEIGWPDVNLDAANRNAVEHPRVRLVTSNFFSVLGVPAYAGRTFAPGAGRAQRADPEVVISYDYWQRRFDGDRAVLGRVIRVNNVPLAIVGVAPPAFTGDVVGETPALWIPVLMAPQLKTNADVIHDRKWSWMQIMGRLKPDVTLAQARAQVATIEAQSIRSHITGVQLDRFNEDLVEDPVRVENGAHGFSDRREEYSRALVVLMVAVGLMILVVCANVSNLMLARAAARGREMTVRITLGAGRKRLLRQLLTESALLAAIAAVLGVVVALVGERILLTLVDTASGRPLILDLHPGLRVLAFTAAITLGCVVLFGLAPALRGTRVDLAEALRAQSRSVFGARSRFGLFSTGKLLVVAQVALSTLLLVGSGLLVRSMQHLLHADLGFDRDHLVAVGVSAGKTTYSHTRLANLRADLAEHARQLPGVDAAAFSIEGVFSSTSGGHVSVPGFVPRADSETQVNLDYVGPGYFRAIGAHILRGRDVEQRDLAGARVGMINQTMADAYFRGRDPIGRTVKLDDETITIAAVVGDVQEQNVRDKPVRRLYIASNDTTSAPQYFEVLVHTPGDPLRIVEPLRRALVAADHTVPFDITPLDDRVRQSVAEDELLTQVTALFAAITLLLAALGLYGVTAYSTAQRTSEFGVRLALGATPRAVLTMVMREAVRVVVIGLVVGVPASLLAVRFVRTQLFGVAPLDPPSLIAAIAVLISAALVASYLPARRAARVGPLEALRGE